MPHQNPNMPTSSPFMGWANPLVGWRETQQQNSPETVLFQPQRQAEPQEHEPEPPLVVTPPLMHAAKGVMRSMRRLLELLVDVTFIIEKARPAAFMDSLRSKGLLCVQLGVMVCVELNPRPRKHGTGSSSRGVTRRDRLLCMS